MAANIVQGGEHRITGIAGGSITGGTMVYWSSGTLVAATDGVSIAGIALDDYETDDIVVVIKAPAVVRIAAATGVDFATGAVCYVATASTVDAGSQNNYSCGRVVNVDPSEAGDLEMELHTDDSGQFKHA